MAKKKPTVQSGTLGEDPTKIVDSLLPLAVAIGDPIVDPANAMGHSDENLDAIRGSLRVYGQRKPIVVNRRNNVVEAGNGTLTAARSLGWQRIAVVFVDDDPAVAAGFAIADNRTAQLAEWDEEALDKLLREVETGDEDLQEMLAKLAKEEELPSFKEKTSEIVEDEIPEPPIEPITQPGDLWIMGDHRLLCGDSTKVEDVARLMGGDKAGMVHTDPPYGMSYQSNMRTKSPKFDVIENDDKILTEWIPLASKYSVGWVFIWTTWKVLDQWFPVVKPFGKLSNMVVWSKGGGGIGDLKKTFSTDHELAFVFNRGSELCGKRIGSVWSFGKDAAGDYLHPTQKPVALAAEAIDKTTRPGAIVYDPFLGSGTTLIAAGQLGRKCYGMEISPIHCDVIVARWEKLTGQKAVRVESQGS